MSNINGLNLYKAVKTAAILAASAAGQQISAKTTGSDNTMNVRRNLGFDSCRDTQAVNCDFITTSEGYKNNFLQERAFKCTDFTGMDVCSSSETLTWQGTNCNIKVISQTNNAKANAN